MYIIVYIGLLATSISIFYILYLLVYTTMYMYKCRSTYLDTSAAVYHCTEVPLYHCDTSSKHLTFNDLHNSSNLLFLRIKAGTLAFSTSLSPPQSGISGGVTMAAYIRMYRARCYYTLYVTLYHSLIFLH